MCVSPNRIINYFHNFFLSLDLKKDYKHLIVLSSESATTYNNFIQSEFLLGFLNSFSTKKQK